MKILGFCGLIALTLECPGLAKLLLWIPAMKKRGLFGVGLRTPWLDACALADLRAHSRVLRCRRSLLTIRHARNLDNACVDRIVTTAIEARAMAALAFGTVDQENVDISIVREGAWGREGQMAFAFFGAFRTKIVIRESALHPDVNLPAVLCHEFSHIAMRTLTKGRCPIWLDEGTARHIETINGLRDEPAAPEPSSLDPRLLDSSFELYDQRLSESDSISLLKYREVANVGHFLVESYVRKKGLSSLISGLRSLKDRESSIRLRQSLLEAALTEQDA
jgi:hypothetical protein